MVADDFGDLRIREAWVLSDHGLLVVLAVKDESCRMRQMLEDRQSQIRDRGEDKCWESRTTTVAKHVKGKYDASTVSWSWNLWIRLTETDRAGRILLPLLHHTLPRNGRLIGSGRAVARPVCL